MGKAHILNQLKWYQGETPFIVGVDPDLRSTAICQWHRGDPFPNDLSIARVARSKEVKGQDCATELRKVLGDTGEFLPYACFALVEGQTVRKAKGAETKNAQSLVDLAACAGVMVGRPEFGEAFMVEPHVWKGTVPKLKHQARILSKFPDTTFKKTKTYCYPTSGRLVELGNMVGLKRGDWKHMVDAIGIAQWAIEQLERMEARERLLHR